MPATQLPPCHAPFPSTALHHTSPDLELTDVLVEDDALATGVQTGKLGEVKD